jgi:hypothetical protein
MGYIDH